MDTPVELGAYVNYGRPRGHGLKLHLGCGDYWMDGYINIDAVVLGGTDMILDIRETLPFQPQTVVMIEAHDVLEHFNRNEVHNMIEDWKRVLIDGGSIDMSVPDMDGLISQYNENKENTIQQIYSIEDHPSHKWGYTVETLEKLFDDHGFKNIKVAQITWKHRPGEPKLRITCQK